MHKYFNPGIFKEICQLYKNGEFYQAHGEIEGALISYTACASIIHTLEQLDVKDVKSLAVTKKVTKASFEVKLVTDTINVGSDVSTDVALEDNCVDCSKDIISNCILKLQTIYQTVLACIETLQKLLKQQKQKNKKNQDDDEEDWEKMCEKIKPKIFKGGDCIFFKDLGGLKDEKDMIRKSLIFPLVYPNLYPKVGKGFLLYGPPGTGKTLLAKAAVNQLQIEDPSVGILFFTPTGATLKGKFVGETEKRIVEAFTCAHKAACKCDSKGNKKYVSVIFIDEMDSVAGDRSNDQTGLVANSVNTLLQMMDGMGSFKNVIVIGATNYPWKLDAAILRRFDTQVILDLPTSNVILDIMNLQFFDFVKIKKYSRDTGCEQKEAEKKLEIEDCPIGCKQQDTKPDIYSPPYSYFKYQYIDALENNILKSYADEMASNNFNFSSSDVDKVMGEAKKLSATAALDNCVFYKYGKFLTAPEPIKNDIEQFYFSSLVTPKNLREKISIYTEYYTLLNNVINSYDITNIGSVLDIDSLKSDVRFEALSLMYDKFYLHDFNKIKTLCLKKNNKIYINSKLLIDKDPEINLNSGEILDSFIYCELDKIIKIYEGNCGKNVDIKTVNMMNISELERKNYYSKYVNNDYSSVEYNISDFKRRPIDIIVRHPRAITYTGKTQQKNEKFNEMINIPENLVETLESLVTNNSVTRLFPIIRIRMDIQNIIVNIIKLFPYQETNEKYSGFKNYYFLYILLHKNLLSSEDLKYFSVTKDSVNANEILDLFNDGAGDKIPEFKNISYEIDKYLSNNSSSINLIFDIINNSFIKGSHTVSYLVNNLLENIRAILMFLDRRNIKKNYDINNVVLFKDDVEINRYLANKDILNKIRRHSVILKEKFPYLGKMVEDIESTKASEITIEYMTPFLIDILDQGNTILLDDYDYNTTTQDDIDDSDYIINIIITCLYYIVETKPISETIKENFSLHRNIHSLFKIEDYKEFTDNMDKLNLSSQKSDESFMNSKMRVNILLNNKYGLYSELPSMNTFQNTDFLDTNLNSLFFDVKLDDTDNATRAHILKNYNYTDTNKFLDENKAILQICNENQYDKKYNIVNKVFLSLNSKVINVKNTFVSKWQEWWQKYGYIILFTEQQNNENLDGCGMKAPDYNETREVNIKHTDENEMKADYRKISSKSIFRRLHFNDIKIIVSKKTYYKNIINRFFDKLCKSEKKYLNKEQIFYKNEIYNTGNEHLLKEHININSDSSYVKKRDFSDTDFPCKKTDNKESYDVLPVWINEIVRNQDYNPITNDNNISMIYKFIEILQKYVLSFNSYQQNLDLNNTYMKTLKKMFVKPTELELRIQNFKKIVKSLFIHLHQFLWTFDIIDNRITFGQEDNSMISEKLNIYTSPKFVINEDKEDEIKYLISHSMGSIEKEIIKKCWYEDEDEYQKILHYKHKIIFDYDKYIETEMYFIDILYKWKTLFTVENLGKIKCNYFKMANIDEYDDDEEDENEDDEEDADEDDDEEDVNIESNIEIVMCPGILRNNINVLFESNSDPLDPFIVPTKSKEKNLTDSDKGINFMADNELFCNKAFYNIGDIYNLILVSSKNCLLNLRIGFGQSVFYTKECVDATEPIIDGFSQINRKYQLKNSKSLLLNMITNSLKLNDKISTRIMYTSATIDVREPNFMGVLRTKPLFSKMVLGLMNEITGIFNGRTKPDKKKTLSLFNTLKKSYNLTMLGYLQRLATGVGLQYEDNDNEKIVWTDRKISYLGVLFTANETLTQESFDKLYERLFSDLDDEEDKQEGYMPWLFNNFTLALAWNNLDSGFLSMGIYAKIFTVISVIFFIKKEFQLLSRSKGSMDFIEKSLKYYSPLLAYNSASLVSQWTGMDKIFSEYVNPYKLYPDITKSIVPPTYSPYSNPSSPIYQDPTTIGLSAAQKWIPSVFGSVEEYNDSAQWKRVFETLKHNCPTYWNPISSFFSSNQTILLGFLGIMLVSNLSSILKYLTDDNDTNTVNINLEESMGPFGINPIEFTLGQYEERQEWVKKICDTDATQNPKKLEALWEISKFGSLLNGTTSNQTFDTFKNIVLKERLIFGKGDYNQWNVLPIHDIGLSISSAIPIDIILAAEIDNFENSISSMAQINWSEDFYKPELQNKINDIKQDIKIIDIIPQKIKEAFYLAPVTYDAELGSDLRKYKDNKAKFMEELKKRSQ